MPHVPRDEHDPAPLAEAVEKSLASIAITTMPVFICGVNRKANVGNFETIDVYAGLALPMGVDPSDLEALQIVLKQVSAVGFKITSEETYEKYKMIKDSLQP